MFLLFTSEKASEKANENASENASENTRKITKHGPNMRQFFYITLCIGKKTRAGYIFSRVLELF